MYVRTSDKNGIVSPACFLRTTSRGLKLVYSGYFHIVVNPKPDNYTLPVFPSLYWPFPVDGRQTHYLYDAKPIWRFTLLWTLISVIGIHVVAASYAVMTHWREWRFIWIVPIVFGVIGGIEALIAGNAVGGL